MQDSFIGKAKREERRKLSLRSEDGVVNKNKIVLHIPQTNDAELLNRLLQVGNQFDAVVTTDGEELRQALCEDAVLIGCELLDDCNVDICLAYHSGWSFDPEVVGIARHTFSRSAYNVRENNLITGCIAPKCDFRYRAMKIVVGKTWYMRVMRNNPRQWMRWAGCIHRIYQQLAVCTPMPRFEKNGSDCQKS